jgi:hypothetical protein
LTYRTLLKKFKNGLGDYILGGGNRPIIVAIVEKMSEKISFRKHAHLLNKRRFYHHLKL